MRTQKEIKERLAGLKRVGFSYNYLGRVSNLDPKTIILLIKEDNYTPTDQTLSRVNSGINTVMDLISSELK